MSIATLTRSQYLCTRKILQTVIIMMLYRILNKVISLVEDLTCRKVNQKYVLKEHNLYLFTCVYKMKNKEQMISLF